MGQGSIVPTWQRVQDKLSCVPTCRQHARQPPDGIKAVTGFYCKGRLV